MSTKNPASLLTRIASIILVVAKSNGGSGVLSGDFTSPYRMILSGLSYFYLGHPPPLNIVFPCRSPFAAIRAMF